MPRSQPMKLIALSVAIGPLILPGQTRASGKNEAMESPTIVYADSILTVPSGVQKIRITVRSSATEGPTPGYTTYLYSVTNEPTAAGGVRRFGLAWVPEPDSVVIPPQWAASFGYEGEDDVLIWAVADAFTPPPAGWEGSTWPSPYEIQPGETKVFAVFCPRHPTPLVSFYAEGFDPHPDADRYSVPALFTAGVTGRTIGPSLPGGTHGGTEVHEREPEQAFPRPEGSSATMATLSFFLPRRADVRSGVYDARGRWVHGLIEGAMPKGFHSITWNGTTSKGADAAAGIYSLRLDVAGRRVGDRKVVLSR